ncbi:hypothetical protein [Siansivirga zeaxanthinifaciens]|uniref:hypothetical protein n=1 Tax=Siansivirga zeaxanthinifaciens TaxID=762954 RepID=UPI000A4E7BDC|nr:hypothetical protein [Siansivirga zeaxanthinifaciens]
MKKFTSILIFSILSYHSYSQAPDYQNLWKRVEQLERDSYTKSALKVVEDISKLALKDKNDPQLIKTMLFKSKFALILEEDAQLKIITDFKN